LSSGYRVCHWAQGLRVQTRKGQLVLKAIQISSTTSFGEKVKPSASYRELFGLLKNSAEYERDISSAIFIAISRQDSPDSLLVVVAAICQRALVDE
jgi:hypothetical protein